MLFSQDLLSEVRLHIAVNMYNFAETNNYSANICYPANEALFRPRCMRYVYIYMSKKMYVLL